MWSDSQSLRANTTPLLSLSLSLSLSQASKWAETIGSQVI